MRKREEGNLPGNIRVRACNHWNRLGEGGRNERNKNEILSGLRLNGKGKIYQRHEVGGGNQRKGRRESSCKHKEM